MTDHSSSGFATVPPAARLGEPGDRAVAAADRHGHWQTAGVGGPPESRLRLSSESHGVTVRTESDSVPVTRTPPGKASDSPPGPGPGTPMHPASLSR
eukprot:3917708-Rhodomonas_salina.1